MRAMREDTVRAKPAPAAQSVPGHSACPRGDVAGRDRLSWIGLPEWRSNGRPVAGW
jgi:hypothetical protein